MGEKIKSHIADALFILGSAAITTGGFFMSVPAGLFISGGCLLAGAFIYGYAEYATKGRGKP